MMPYGPLLLIDGQRRSVVEAARAWIGTPYHHMGRVRGAGVDCGTLIEQSYIDARVKLRFEIPAYSQQWHLHRADPVYERLLDRNGFHLVASPGIGDIALFKVARQHAHGAIVSGLGEQLRIIHAYSPSRAVVEGFEFEFGDIAGADRKFFSMW